MKLSTFLHHAPESGDADFDDVDDEFEELEVMGEEEFFLHYCDEVKLFD